ncbi:hypothetical protein T08_7562 [Trichinella sp. T8]|nr:hypothetical protein T08_7562 [Trichinella sp. T8]
MCGWTAQNFTRQDTLSCGRAISSSRFGRWRRGFTCQCEIYIGIRQSRWTNKTLRSDNHWDVGHRNLRMIKQAEFLGK